MGMTLLSYEEDEFIADLERQIFDERNAYLKEKSRADGIQKRIAKNMELEIEGVEDILEFLDSTSIEVGAIRERLRRMRDILKEEY